MALPKELRERPRVPHRLLVCSRVRGLPDAGRMAAFCGLRPDGAGEGWLRAVDGPTRVLVLVPEGGAPGPEGWEHVLEVESGSARPCFLAAYFAARDLGGVVWVQKRFEAFAPARFAELFLGDVDVEAAWPA